MPCMLACCALEAGACVGLSFGFMQAYAGFCDQAGMLRCAAYLSHSMLTYLPVVTLGAMVGYTV